MRNLLRLLFVSLSILFSLFFAPCVYAFGANDTVVAKLLRLNADKPLASRKKGVDWMHYVVSKRTSIDTGRATKTSLRSDSSIRGGEEISIDSPHLFETPFLYLIADHPLPTLTPTQRERLATYLTSGGFLFIDSTEGIPDGPVAQSVKTFLHDLFPDRTLAPVDSDHVIYSSFYLLNQPYGRNVVDPNLYAISDDTRLLVLFNPNDLAGALARNPSGGWLFATNPAGEKGHEYALRFAVNLFMYATCLNYKKDQAHIPFIMKRRNWKL